MKVKFPTNRKCTINCGDEDKFILFGDQPVCENAIINGANQGKLEVNSLQSNAMEGARVTCPRGATCNINCDTNARGNEYCEDVQIC